jgi:hypothetical protein
MDNITFGGNVATEYSVEDLLEFLTHASDRGLMPAATAQSLAVATRSVLGVLSESEQGDVRKLDLESVRKRFSNKRAKDFTPASLREYSRRLERAVSLFLTWRDDPAGFSVPTRATSPARKRDARSRDDATTVQLDEVSAISPVAPSDTGRGFQSAFPIRPGHIVVISNIPPDLTATEADRLGAFVKMLATE